MMAVTAALVTLVGCSGVPGQSDPQIVRSIGGNQSSVPQPTTSPLPGADPRSIVTSFLAANVSSDERHTAARLFLTPDASPKWQDRTATIVDTFQIGVADLSTATVTVSARRVGQVDASGIYTPTLPTAGPETFTFGMKQVDKQWRIDQLQQGLLVDESSFESAYSPHPIYFFDLAPENTLIPDVRYSATSGQSLASFLLRQVLAGPRPELQSAVQLEIPDQGAAVLKPLTLGGTVAIDLVGIKALDAQTRKKIAAQLAYTLDPISTLGFSLTEGGQNLPIAGVGARFSRSDFPTVIADRLSDPSVYYLRDGQVISDLDNKPVAGQAGSNQFGLTTIAMRSTSSGPRVAAVAQTAAGATLYLGGIGATETLQAVAWAPATMTRPSWAAAAGEVWVSDGTQLVRVRADRSYAAVSLGGLRSDGGTIRAVRVARDGTRIALIYGENAQDSELWIGSIVRNNENVKVDKLVQITPKNLFLNDVAWSDETTLLITGRDVANPASQFGIWSVQVDGSVIRTRSTGGLPGAPSSVTAGPGQLPWVEAETTVWEQRGSLWGAPRGDSGLPQKGTAPVYSD
jgi:hypothetical protein